MGTDCNPREVVGMNCNMRERVVRMEGVIINLRGRVTQLIHYNDLLFLFLKMSMSFQGFHKPVQSVVVMLI